MGMREHIKISRMLPRSILPGKMPWSYSPGEIPQNTQKLKEPFTPPIKFLETRNLNYYL
jgi:hypothetical protein